MLVQMNELRVSDKQKEAIHNCVRGHDCFVILPTGVRENVVLCLAAFRVRDRLSSKENTSVFYCTLRFAVGISKP